MHPQIQYFRIPLLPINIQLNLLVDPKKKIYRGWIILCPRIRIPKEEISVDPSIDYQYGDVEITIHTPTQGTFQDKNEINKLYETE